MITYNISNNISVTKKYIRSFTLLKKFFSTFMLIGIAVLLTRCDAPLTEKMASESDHSQVTIATGQDLNGKMAIRVDMVQVYEQQLFETLKQMDATLFRQKKRQILLDHHDDMALWSYDFTTGQTETFSFPTNRNYFGIIIYLHFIDNPENRIVLTKAGNIRLQIAEGSFKITHDSKWGKYISLEEGGNT